MKTYITLFSVITCIAFAPAQGDDRGSLIFNDDFNREDGSKEKDALGNGWSTASEQRAAGNKQVALKNGALYIALHPVADHAVSVRHDAEFTDGTVELRFLLEDAKDTLGVNIADLQCKDVHAGHLFKVVVGTKNVSVDDLKSGIMNLKFEEAKKSKTLTPEQQKFIASTRKSFPAKLEVGKWYGLRIRIIGDTVRVAIDNKELGSFASEGFAHPTKRMIRLSVPRQAVVDDIEVYSLAAEEARKGSESPTTRDEP